MLEFTLSIGIELRWYASTKVNRRDTECRMIVKIEGLTHFLHRATRIPNKWPGDTFTETGSRCLYGRDVEVVMRYH